MLEVTSLQQFMHDDLVHGLHLELHRDDSADIRKFHHTFGFPIVDAPLCWPFTCYRKLQFQSSSLVSIYGGDICRGYQRSWYLSFLLIHEDCIAGDKHIASEWRKWYKKFYQERGIYIGNLGIDVLLVNWYFIWICSFIWDAVSRFRQVLHYYAIIHCMTSSTL
jgi:hypothetical protein